MVRLRFADFAMLCMSSAWDKSCQGCEITLYVLSTSRPLSDTSAYSCHAACVCCFITAIRRCETNNHACAHCLANLACQFLGSQCSLSQCTRCIVLPVLRRFMRLCCDSFTATHVGKAGACAVFTLLPYFVVMRCNSCIAIGAGKA